jgi:hypothetical protein
MAAIFQSSAIMEDEESGANNNDDLTADVKQDSIIAHNTDSSTIQKTAKKLREKK